MNYAESSEAEFSASSNGDFGTQSRRGDTFNLLMRDLDKLSIEAHLEHDGGYEEFIEVFIPAPLAELYGIAGLMIPIHDLLTFVAERKRDSAERLIALRDDWYPASYGDDGIGVDESSINPLMTREQRAIMQFERKKLNANRAPTEAIDALNKPPHDRFGFYGIFAAERWALEAERVGLDKEFHQLQAEWNRFVAERATWSGDFGDKEAKFRSEIRSKEEQYGARREDWERRLSLLDERALPRSENDSSHDEVLVDLEGI